eukprot:1182562-Prorocentrum_minimum.AAC.2
MSSTLNGGMPGKLERYPLAGRCWYPEFQGGYPFRVGIWIFDIIPGDLYQVGIRIIDIIPGDLYQVIPGIDIK